MKSGCDARPGLKLIGVLAAACGGGLAVGQETPSTTASAEAPEPLAEIIVTSQKRAEKLQEVPASVSVVSADQIVRSNAVTMEGLLNQIPGMSFHKGDIPFNSSIFLRGIGTNSFALGAEPSVAYVLDGVVMGTSGQALGDLLDVERIEVIPGPQGTLFGKNSSAGVVNVVSRMPGTQYAADFQLGYFEGDETRAKASIDLPVTDWWLTRTTVFTGKYGGNITNVHLPSQDPQPAAQNGYDHQGVRSIWKVLAGDNLTFTLIADWRQAHDNCCTFVSSAPGSAPGASAPVVAGLDSLLAGVHFAGDETRQVASNLVTQSIERERGTSLQMDWDVNRYTLTNILSYRYWYFDEIHDNSFLPVAAPFVGISFEQVHDFGPQTTSTLTDELRLASPTGGILEYVLGLYYYHTVQDRYFERDDTLCQGSTLPAIETGLTPCLPGLSTYITPSANATFGADIDNYAAFGQGTIRIVDPLRAIIGLRGTHDDISMFHHYNPATVPGGGAIIAANCSPQPTCPFEGTGSTSHSNVSGKAGLQWQMLKTEMAYFTYSRGYKGPAYNVYFNQTNVQNAPLPPETSIAYEAGLKSTLLQGNAYINFAIYHEAFNHFQANNPVLLNGVGVTTLADAGQAATQGIELSGAVQLTSVWDLSAGFAYTDAHVVQFNSPPGAKANAIAAPGSPLPFAPKEKLNVATDYRVTGALPFDVLLHTDYDYTSPLYTDFATCSQTYCPNGGENPYLKLHGYGLWNGSIGASDRQQRLTVTALVKNILNDHYATHSAIGGPGGSLGNTILYFIPRDADRYWGLQLDYKFNE